MQFSSVVLTHAAATDVVLKRHQMYPSAAERAEKIERVPEAYLQRCTEALQLLYPHCVEAVPAD